MLLQMKVLLGLILVVGAVERFTVQDGTKTCLIMEADVQGEIKWQNGTEIKSYSWTLAQVQEMSGDCNAKYQGLKSNKLDVTFSPANPKSPRFDTVWKFSLQFAQSDNKTYELVDWSLMFAQREDLPFTDTYTKSKDAVIDISAYGKNAYKCSSEGLAMNFSSVLTLKSLKVLAFANLDTKDFPDKQVYEVCRLDSKTSDIVPMIVGGCLAGLVVIVLIAYLVGRARAKRQGYASV